MSGEFSNIKNHPVWQKKTFATSKTRFVKLSALSNTTNDKIVTYAGFDIITEYNCKNENTNFIFSQFQFRNVQSNRNSIIIISVSIPFHVIDNGEKMDVIMAIGHL